MSELKLYPALSTCSKIALRKQKKKYGQPYVYNPRGRLLTRLSEEFKMTKEEVYNQLLKEREQILSQGI